MTTVNCRNLVFLTAFFMVAITAPEALEPQQAARRTGD